MLDLSLTLLGIALGLGLFFLASHKSGQPPRDDLKPRMVPWRFLIILAGFWIILMVVHLINILGVETGPDKSPFMRRF